MDWEKNSLLERSACFTGLRVTSDESAVALGLKQHWTYLQPQKHLENLVPGAQTTCSALSTASSLTSRSKCGVWREAQQAFVVHNGCTKNDGSTEGWGVGGSCETVFPGSAGSYIRKISPAWLPKHDLNKDNNNGHTKWMGESPWASTLHTCN